MDNFVKWLLDEPLRTPLEYLSRDKNNLAGGFQASSGMCSTEVQCWWDCGVYLGPAYQPGILG